MTTFSNSTASSFQVKINGSPALGYETSSAPFEITVSIGEQILDASLFNETNYLISSGIPDDVVPASLTISFDRSALTTGKRFGFRLSNSGGDSDFQFTTANTTDFGDSITPLAIADSTPALSGDTFIWSTADTIASPTGQVSIPININYVATTKTPGDTVTFSIDIAESNINGENYTNLVNIATVSATTVAQGETPRNLTATVFSAEITTTMDSFAQEALTTSKQSFLRNALIALKATLVKSSTVQGEETNEYYRPATEIVFKETVSKYVVLDSLYATLKATPADVDELKNDSTTTVAVDLTDTTENLAAKGVVITVGADSNEVAVTMPTSTDYDILFDGSGDSRTLKSTVYIYITGKIVIS